MSAYTDPMLPPEGAWHRRTWESMACPLIVEPDGGLSRVRPFDIDAMWDRSLPADRVREIVILRILKTPR